MREHRKTRGPLQVSLVLNPANFGFRLPRYQPFKALPPLRPFAAIYFIRSAVRFPFIHLSTNPPLLRVHSCQFVFARFSCPALREPHTKRAKTTQETRRHAPIYREKLVALLMLKLCSWLLRSSTVEGEHERYGACRPLPCWICWSACAVSL